jgi:hypothetical protein
MIRPEFTFELGNAIQECIKIKKTVLKTGIELSLGLTDKLLGIMSIEVRSLKLNGVNLCFSSFARCRNK